jgi:hypothetical protein
VVVEYIFLYYEGWLGGDNREKCVMRVGVGVEYFFLYYVT